MRNGNYQPGEVVRVRTKTMYEPLAHLMRERQTDAGFEIVKSDICKYARYTDEFTSTYETVQVRYPDGSLSGAIYADIFERVIPE
jgi:hypothetical protein